MLCSGFVEVTLLCVIALNVAAGASAPPLGSEDGTPKCLSLWNTAGVTSPEGDITLKAGTPLEIVCVLTSNEYDASSLRFFRSSQEMVPQGLTRAVNGSAVRLFIESPPPSKERYYCRALKGPHLQPSYSNTELLCWNDVAVDDEPKEVDDFECVSYNWEKLVCTWTPQASYVKTNYSLSYSHNGLTFYKCPGSTETAKSMCQWDMNSSPRYLLTYRTLYFKMVIENTFGRTSKTYEIDHFGHVVPNKAEDLRLVRGTVDSVTLSWKQPPAFRYFPPGLINRVIYKSRWDSEKVWHEVDTSQIPKNATDVTLTVSGLKYAHSLYDFRVFLRSAVARKEPYTWSEAATVIGRTAPTVPSAPPETDIGAYRVINENSRSRDLLVYWRKISPQMENGDNFHYKVIEVAENRSKRNLRPGKVTDLYARFDDVATKSNCTFRIVSSNSVGDSSTFSEVFLPSSECRPPEPEHFTTIVNDGGDYELSWRPPMDATNIKSYTLFWCENNSDRLFECTGELSWIRVPNDVTSKLINLSEATNYQFSISANSDSSSSGMVWPSCTLASSKDIIANIKGISVDKIETNFIEVHWTTDCTLTHDIIQNLSVYYCPVITHNEHICQEPEQKTMILAKFDQEIKNHIYTNITELKPYTSYMIYLAIQKKNWIERSNPYFLTTSETAPDAPPRDVKVVDITNSSLTLTWLPPEVLNGKIRHYILFWGNSYSTIVNQTSATLTNLNSVTLYNVSVAACTISCSPESTPVSVETSIGTPERIRTPTLVESTNSTKLDLFWEEPLKLCDNCSYYEVKVRLERNEQLLNENYYNLTGPPYNFTASDCEGSSYDISVRAINIDENENRFFGPWSPSVTYLCSRQKVSWAVIAPICFTLALASFIFLIWAYMCIMKRKDVEIQLPRTFGNGWLNIKEQEAENNFAIHINADPNIQEYESYDWVDTEQYGVTCNNPSDEPCMGMSQAHPLEQMSPNTPAFSRAIGEGDEIKDCPRHVGGVGSGGYVAMAPLAADLTAQTAAIAKT